MYKKWQKKITTLWPLTKKWFTQKPSMGERLNETLDAVFMGSFTVEEPDKHYLKSGDESYYQQW